MANGQQTITDYLESIGSVDVAWLYGSRAKGSHSQNSDWDIAVAMAPGTAGSVDDLTFDLSQRVDQPVSVVDINRIPSPLAQNVIESGKVLLCRSYLRLRLEEQRVWSLWEAYKFEHEQNRKHL